MTVMAQEQKDAAQQNNVVAALLCLSALQSQVRTKFSTNKKLIIAAQAFCKF